MISTDSYSYITGIGCSPATSVSEGNEDSPIQTPSRNLFYHATPPSPPTSTYKAEAWKFGGISYYSSGKRLSFPFPIDERLQKLAYQMISLTWRRLSAPARHLADSEIDPVVFNKLIAAHNQKVLAAASVQACEESNLAKATTRRGLPLGFSFACGKTIPSSVAAWGKSDPTEFESQHFQGHFEVFGERVSYLSLCEGDKEIVKFCKEKLADCIHHRLMVELENLESGSKLPIIQDALAIAIVDLNNTFSLHGKKTFKGASLNTAFIYENRLWIVNLGNARALLVGSCAEQIPLSSDNPTLRIGLPKATRAEVCFKDCPKGGWEDWHLVQTTNGIHKRSAEKTVALSSVDISLMLCRLHFQDSTPLLKVASQMIIEAYESGGTGNLHVAITPLRSFSPTLPPTDVIPIVIQKLANRRA